MDDASLTLSLDRNSLSLRYQHPLYLYHLAFFSLFAQTLSPLQFSFHSTLTFPV